MPINQIQDSDTAKCINSCLSCARICIETLHYCLDQKGTAYSGKLLALLQFCSDACNLSAKLMIAESEFHHQACELSFQLCDTCAVECARYEGDDVIEMCAEACRDCAEACRGMAGMTVRMPYHERVERDRGIGARM
ncbi:four-helix bundle copper-binding protein [Bdellovibrio bacteriovorus]|uniref:four-helix bundle copper-binding protein n=1 Tax=Bdellovibrio bacteriovorus TaxID=959 RepID=UPI0035A71276